MLELTQLPLLQILKALHVVSVVAWFAGLFYIVRLFIYHTEAKNKPEPDQGILKAQFAIMERRLWYAITWPAMVMTVAFGGTLAWKTSAYLEPWFHFKLFLVLLLVAYHFLCGAIRKQLVHDVCTWTSFKLRLLNEVPTVLLVGIVMVVYLKDTANTLWSLASLVILAVLLGFAVAAYRKKR
ncbi:MAG: CopD family protein [Candidatus Margulisiibacteriota bacterium]